jgi:hypothetical protein
MAEVTKSLHLQAAEPGVSRETIRIVSRQNRAAIK